MTEADEQNMDPMQAGLEGAAQAPSLIAKQLRMMAAGEAQYQRFTYMSPWIKNIWNAAADIIEDCHKKNLH